jgi:[FeFe] hydrogenase (group B1/B3)
MAFLNNVMIVRHKLLANLVSLWKKGELVEKIDRLPLELSPRNSKHLGRCCVHKERAVWKYKCLPLLGLDMTDEKDELDPLSKYAQDALDRKKWSKDNILCVIDEACSSCVHINYEITNLCYGCVARSCYVNCPKEAIHFQENGQAKINHDTCINCGTCFKSCPYHAIVYMPVPCEESCPVKAISRDENGVQHIDESKCIYCGKCLNACPFGAIFELSQTFDVLNAIQKGEKVVAIVAPAILGQFNATIEQVYGALRQVGFSDVIEVAQGAMETTQREAEELRERLSDGKPFMTTSCCPSYIELVNKHIPSMIEFVSETRSPMYYTAKMAKVKHPDAKIVFVGPCIAKRKEMKRDEHVDFVLTFEEIASIFVGLDIDLPQIEPLHIDEKAVREAHGFAQTGGVAESVRAYLNNDKLSVLQVADINKKNIGLLRSIAKTKKSPNVFIEVMACEGGCISGPCNYNDSASGRRKLAKALEEKVDTYANRC